jgi:GNAT superfamily N-acetyltransferase
VAVELARNGYHDVAAGKLATIVTFLEMTERPAPRPVPPRPDLALRRVGRPDPAWYRDLFRRIGLGWLWSSRVRMADQELARIVRHPRVEIWALAREGTDAGLLELDRRTPGEVELAFFGLTPDLLGGGAGRLLMNRAIEIAWSTAPRRFWLHTCTLDHPAALGFYRRSGFRAYRQAVEIADDPRLTGELPPGAAPHIPVIP